MAVIIQAVGFANGEHCPHAGMWLATFDHDAFEGRGFGTFTGVVERAMRFEDSIKALEFWRRQSTVNPIRQDGKPNRPMTALTVTIERIS